MSYTIHNFQQGDVLYANQLNEMDAQILLNDEEAEVYQSLTNSGTYTITTNDLESGQWSYSRKDDNETRARTKFLIPVHAGMTIDYENTTFDVFFGVLETPTSMTYIAGQSGWKTDSQGTFNITNDGYLTFVIRNHLDNTVAVNPSDFNSHVNIKTIVLQSIDELNDDLYTLDKTFSQNLEEINGIYTFPVINGYASDINSIISKNNKWLINSDYLYFNNEFIKITIDNGYNGYILWKISNDTAAVRALSSGIHYFYGGKNIPVRILIHKNDQSLIMLDEITHVKIEKVLQNTKDIGCGINEHSIVYEKNTSINATYLYPHNNIDNNTDISQPIKIPKSGLRIAVNPIYRSREYLNQDDPHIPRFRIVAVKKGDNGLVLQTDDDGVLAVSQSITTSLASVYIPYIEHGYIFVVMGRPNTLYPDHDYSDFLVVTSGIVTNSYSGVYNIFPTAITVDIVEQDGTEENQLNIRGRGSYQYINSVTSYYATVLRLNEAKRIAVSSKYTIMAVIYKINDDGSITRYDDVFGTWSIFSNSAPGYMQISTSGVSVIDFDQYDFDGYALIAIQCPVVYERMTSSSGYHFLRLTMGGLHGYEDVMNNLSVEYKNSITISTVSGMPAILDENIKKLCDWKVDVYPHGYYTEAYETNSYYFPDMYNCFPSLYQGTYVANTVLMNVTAKSALTCLHNPNGRMRKMKRSNDGSEGKGRIGYGITCTNFGSIVRGLRENYTNYALVYGTNMKFDRTTFTYPGGLYDLRPGDMLSKHKVPEDPIAGRDVDAHCMTVHSIVVVNGVIKAVNVIEGSWPAPRLNTFLAMDYYITDGNPENWITNYFSMDVLANYTAINRIKPEYLKRVTDIYDLYPENTNVGTVMCDRGTESIYGARTHFIELTVSDSEAESLTLFKDGTQVANISLSGASTENNMRVVNVISYIDGEGLYTVETDTEPGVIQETFFVKSDVEEMTVSSSGDTVTLTVPNVSDLVFLDIWYGQSEPFEVSRYRKSFTYIPDDPNQISINLETNTGTVVLPKFIDQIQFNGATRVYSTQYGTYYANRFGRVSTENYSYDVKGDNLNNS